METTIYIKIDFQYVPTDPEAPFKSDENLIQLAAGQPFRIFMLPWLPWLANVSIDNDLVSNGSPEEMNPRFIGAVVPNVALTVRAIAVDFTFFAGDPRIDAEPPIEISYNTTQLPDFMWVGATYYRLFTDSDDTYSGWGGALMQKLLWEAPDGSYDGRSEFYDAKGGNDTVDLPDAATADAIRFDRGRMFSAGAGDDLITGSAEADRISGDGGADTLVGGAGRDMLSGGEGTDLLEGGDDADTLTGSDGADTLDGGGGIDSLHGGGGNDVYLVDDVNDSILEAVGPDYDIVIARTNYTLSAGLEELRLLAPVGVGRYGTGNGLANRMTGTDGADTLTGGGGNDTLSGGEGDDQLNGGTGADSMAGGAGNDVYVVDNEFDLVVEEASGGIDTVRTTVNHTLAAEVEHLVILGSGHVIGTGNALANVITGNAGDNALDGAGGADTLIGGAGNDRYYVDDPGDRLIEKAGEGLFDAVSTVISLVLPAHIEILQLIGAVGLAGTGNSLDNTLIGGSYADTLNGGAGNDTLLGGGGNDLYIVDAGDLPWEVSDVGGIDTVRTAFHRTLVSFIENLQITGAIGRRGTGNELANVINGGNGADTLSGLGGADRLGGGAGNDRLDGGAGVDALTGGAGADTFAFTGPADGGDAIADFATGLDRIEVSAATFGGGLVAGQLPAPRFTTNLTGLATTAGGEFTYETDAGRLWWDADGTGAGARVLVARLSGAVPIEASDIWVA